MTRRWMRADLRRTVAGLWAGAIVACGGSSQPPGPSDLPADPARPDATAAEEIADPFESEVFVHTQKTARTGLATGDFNRPGLEYEPIPVDPKYRHVLAFQMTPMLPPIREGIPSNGPLILYSDDLETLVFSPLDHFFLSLVWFDGQAIRSGLAGEVQEVPAGFTHRFLLVHGHGVNATVEAWGERLRAEHGRAATDRYAGEGLSRIGYWTDNGTRYYYLTAPGLNEQDTLLAVRADLQARGVPAGYLQLDSWWYFKDPGTGLLAGGLVEWKPKPEMFPQGLAAFQQQLGLPLILHNRWFAPKNVYRERYAFVDGPQMSFPASGEVFEEFLADAASWGAITYEQDWLITQFWGVPWLREAVGRAEQWMGWIHDAAVRHGLTVQLCMPGPGHLLDAVARPAFTTIRTSVDHMTERAKEAYWPPFHIVNMVAAAVGILPFKDNFLTTEFRAEAEALISVLSAGMVGIGDEIGHADPALVARIGRPDGLILKPDRPATPLDAMFLPNERPFLVRTWSDRAGLGRWVYLAAFNLALEHPERLDEDRFWSAVLYDGMPLTDLWHLPDRVTDSHVDLLADLHVTGPVVDYNWRTGEASVQRSGVLDLGPIEHFADYAYHILAPVLPNGLALIGEADKFVTLADRRFRSIEVQPDSLVVTVEGVPGESVTLLAFDAQFERLLAPVQVSIGPDGSATTTLSRSPRR